MYASGILNPSWKGDEVGYNALHVRMRRLIPKPDRCTMCKMIKPLDLANISGKYLTVVSDWHYICRKCHFKSDGRAIKISDNRNDIMKRDPKTGRYVSPSQIRTSKIKRSDKES